MNQFTRGASSRPVAGVLQDPIKGPLRLARNNLARKDTIEEFDLLAAVGQRFFHANVVKFPQRGIMDRSSDHQVEQRSLVPRDRHLAADVARLAKALLKDVRPEIRTQEDLESDR